MNAKASKKLRRAVYGDYALRDTKYEQMGRTMVSTGRRRAYRLAKRVHRQMRGDGFSHNTIIQNLHPSLLAKNQE